MKALSNLDSLCARLAPVTSLRYESSSNNSESGWSGYGNGEVVVETAETGALLFHERGKWTPNAGATLMFTNVYRWTAMVETDSMRLEHLRFGANSPVYLFDLQQIDGKTWQSIEPHVCREDLYNAELILDPEYLSLEWTVRGPSKDEIIRYWYR